MRVLNTHVPGYARQPGVEANFMAALVADDRGKVAVYVGLVLPVTSDAERLDAAMWLSQRGSKLPYQQAVTHFPRVKEADYRA